jgi:Flp pilus assembly protein TadD
VLKLGEKILGPKHPVTLRCMNNLGVALRVQGRYREAEGIYRQALELGEKVLGLEHPSTCRVAENLARVLWGQKQYEGASTLVGELVPRRQQINGMGG